MITALSKENIKKNYGAEFVEVNKISRFGGLLTFIEFVKKFGLAERLEPLVGRSAAKAICQIALTHVVGAKTMEQVALFAHDPLIKAFLGQPFSATYVPRILSQVSKQQIQSLHEFNLSNGLLDIASSTVKEEFQTFDFDATHREKYGKQEGVERGYIGDDMLAKCYQYLFIRSDSLNSIVYGTIRGGSAHSQNDFCYYLRMILEPFKSAWALRIRADSAYYNEEAFDICQENNAFFFIKAPMIPTRRAQAESDQLVWKQDSDDPNVEYATHQSCTVKRTPIIEVFKRTPDPKEKGSYRYDCIATNDMRASPVAVYNFYNGRANIENNNAELKNDLALGKLVTKSFDVNDIITQALICIYQLLSHFKRTCLDKADREKRTATLRDELFLAPGEVLSSARRSWLRIYTLVMNPTTNARILARIAALKNAFVLFHQLKMA